MKTGYKVGDMMTENPVVVSKETTLQQAAKIMKDNKVGALLVGEEDVLFGIITEQDVVRKAIINAKPSDKTKVFDIMETSLITITPDKDIFEALKNMGENNIRHLPVVNKKGKFIGLITGKDILKVQPQLFELLVDKIELKEEEKKNAKLEESDY